MTKVSFHQHETVGASKVYKWMEGLGFAKSDCIRVSKLVKHHQFRFYEDTARSTIRKWVEEIGKQGFDDIVKIRLADRAGNLKNKDKPLYTRQLTDLITVVQDMIDKKEVVFFEDLAINYKDMNRMAIPKEKYKEAISNMLGIVRANPARNTSDYLTKYLQRNYKGK